MKTKKDLPKLKAERIKKHKELKNQFGIPEVCGYALTPQEEAGQKYYRVDLSISKAGYELEKVESGEEVLPKPNEYAKKIGLPDKVKGVDVKYFFTEVFLGNWWDTDIWKDILEESRAELDMNIPVNQPYSDNPEILDLRIHHNTIFGGVEIFAESEHAILMRGATLGGFVWDVETSEPFLLSNTHVLAPKGTEVGQPVYQPRKPRKIAEVARIGAIDSYTEENWTLDVSIAQLSPGIQFDYEWFGPAGEMPNVEAVEPEIGDTVFFVGRSSGYQESTISSIGSVFNNKISYRTSTTISQSGDSGSRVFLKDSGNPIGIIWGHTGGIHGESSVIVPALFIEDDLGVTFLRPSVPRVDTLDPTAIMGTEATLHGELTDLGEETEVDVFFQYREVGESVWTETARQELTALGVFDTTLTTLDPGTNYEFRVGVEWDLGAEQYFGLVIQFATDSVVDVDKTIRIRPLPSICRTVPRASRARVIPRIR